MASIGGDLEKKHQLLKILDKRVDFFGSHMRITTGAFFDIWKACCMLNVLTPKEVGDYFNIEFKFNSNFPYSFYSLTASQYW